MANIVSDGIVGNVVFSSMTALRPFVNHLATNLLRQVNESLDDGGKMTNLTTLMLFVGKH